MPPSPEQASVPHAVPGSSTEIPVTMSSNPHPSPRSKPQPPPRPVHIHPEVQQTLHNPTPSVQPVMNPQPMMNQPHVMNPQPAMPSAFSPQQQVALYQVSFILQDFQLPLLLFLSFNLRNPLLRKAVDLFACRFCFSNTDHVTIPRTGEYFLSTLDIFMLARSLFNEYSKGPNLPDTITRSVLRNQNLQAKKVYCYTVFFFSFSRNFSDGTDLEACSSHLISISCLLALKSHQASNQSST